MINISYQNFEFVMTHLATKVFIDYTKIPEHTIYPMF